MATVNAPRFCTHGHDTYEGGRNSSRGCLACTRKDGTSIISSTKRRCEVERCERPHFGQGYCSTHYVRWRTHGTPQADKPILIPGIPTADRFWRQVSPPNARGCREWSGAQHNYGYGNFRLKGKTEKAHRIAWELTYGTIPKGLHVLHACDNPPCVNPSHLSVGTHAENMATRRHCATCQCFSPRI